MTRFLKVSSYYPGHLTSFFACEDMSQLSYDQLYRRVMDDCFGWSDFWKVNLEKTGLYDAHEIVVNAELLQKKWATESGVSFTQSGWKLEILEAQLEVFRPDIIFINDFGNVTPEFRKKMRQRFPSIKLVIGWDGVAHNDPVLFEGYDLILSCLGHVVSFYKEHGFNSLLFPLGFETSILQRIDKRPFQHDVSFVGSVFTGKNFHNERLDLLAFLTGKIPLEMWASGVPTHPFFSVPQIKRLVRRRFSEFGKIATLARINRGQLFGTDMYQALSDSKMTLNHHIDASGSKAGNLRLFEATGAGTCLVTDWKENLKDYFEPDVEVVTYRSPEECLEKITYLLTHEEERKKIAAAGQKRTLEQYSYEKRLSVFSDTLQSLIANA